MMFYVKPNSNCPGLSLVTLDGLLSGSWEDTPCWRGRPVVKTGQDMTPRAVVGWSSLLGGSGVDLAVYRRTDRPALAFVGADFGLRILANEDEDPEPEPGAEHLPAGWGLACMTVYELEDLLDEDLQRLWPAMTRDILTGA